MKRTLVFVVVLVASAALPAVAAGQPDARDADLGIETPAGTDAQVSQQTVNGTRQYTTSVSPLELHPQNFAMDSVVDFGVATPGGSIAQQTTFGQYQFRANASGTYRVYWIVSEQVVTNTTTNATTTSQVRYEALIRITGEPGVQTLSTGQYQQLRENAKKWTNYNSSVLQPLMQYESFYAPEPESTHQLAYDKMPTAYRNIHNIIARLGGNISTILLTLVMTLGGLFLFAIVGAYHLYVTGKLYRMNNTFWGRQEREGDISERQRDLDATEREFTMENTDLQDVPGITDREAEVLREQLDIVSVRDLKALLEADGPLSDVAVTLDRLHAMGAAGYGATVTPDGDGDGYDVTLHTPGDVPDSEELPEDEPVTTPGQIDGETWVDLAAMDADMDELVLTHMDEWGGDVWRSFSHASADYDPEDVRSNLDSLDIEGIQQALGLDDHRFSDPGEFGRMLYDLLEYIRLHPSTDGDGSPNPTREAAETLLKVENVLADQFQSPTHEHRRDGLERALQDWDVNERSEQTVQDARSGAGVGSD